MPLASHPSNSTIRRKPQYTYKSPSAQDWGPVLPRTSTIQSAQSRITATSSARIPMKNSASSSYVSKPIKRKNNGILPALPLYHPMGTLALSLPPLDPASFGLPSPVTSDDNHAAHGPSSHIRSPANHPGHEQDDTLTVGTIAAVATQETTEKATPRKRRSAGGSKRKRKDVDDGDPTYPTRRTRLPRSVIHQAESEEPSEEAVAVGHEEIQVTVILVLVMAVQEPCHLGSRSPQPLHRSPRQSLMLPLK
ncbi:hypothetical protein BDQ17DRAFT_181487 [Cyathus striatus]|nr:hypothetical protein BDQ17DRAFT_181487 [Cyathus striatus]